MRPLITLCAAVLIIATSLAEAADWTNCADDLDYLRRRAGDASDKAREVDSKRSEFERKREELRTCVQFPESFDLMRDRCQSLRSAAESAQRNYRSELTSLGSALDDVDRKIRSVNSSCTSQLQQTLGPPAPVPQGASDVGSCRIYRNYKVQLPMAKLLEVCRTTMTEQQCKACLQP